MLPLLKRRFSFSNKVNALIQKGTLKVETAQDQAIKALSHLSESLNSDESSSSYWFRRPAPKSVYIYGSVGKKMKWRQWQSNGCLVRQW
jgi:predicted ATPase